MAGTDIRRKNPRTQNGSGVSTDLGGVDPEEKSQWPPPVGGNVVLLGSTPPSGSQPISGQRALHEGVMVSRVRLGAVVAEMNETGVKQTVDDGVSETDHRPLLLHHVLAIINTPAHKHPHTRPHAHTRTSTAHPNTHTLDHMHTRTNTHAAHPHHVRNIYIHRETMTRTRAHTHAHTHTRTRARARAHTHTHTHTHGLVSKTPRP